MPLDYHVICTVCNACVASGYPVGGLELDKWLRHLLQEGHQVLAREELLRHGNGGKGEGRVSTLVVFGTTVGVGEDEQLIKFLSTRVAGAVVADVVCYPEWPKTGFVQFESVRKAQLVFDSLEGDHFRVASGQCCQLKDWPVPDSLWTFMLVDGYPRFPFPASPEPPLPLPEPSSSSSPAGTGTGSATAIVPKVCNDVDVTQLAPELETEIPEVPSTSTSASVSSMALGATADNWEKGAGGSSMTMTLCLELDSHLQSIRKLMQIPDEEYVLAQKVNNRLQNLINADGGKKRGFQNLLGFGPGHHWLLKLKYSPKGLGHNSPLTTYLFYGPDSDDDDKRQKIDKMLFNKDGGINDFLSFEVLPGFPQFMHVPDSAWDDLLYKIKNPETGLPFILTVTSSTFYGVEAQIWRLLQYLCQFDPHCYPVLTVLLYWAQLNSVTLGSPKVAQGYYDGSMIKLAEPLGLSWLLMLFFQKEGRIPSPKKLMDAPHHPIPFNGKDLGFADGDEAVATWRASKKVDDQSPEQFAEEVFTLLYKFFLFSANTLGDGKPWILDTMYGVIHSLHSSIRDGLDIFKPSNKSRPSVKKITVFAEEPAAIRLVMMDPLMGRWRISTSHAYQAFDAMKETGLKLKDYLEQVEMGGAKKLELDQFLELLKVEKS